MGISYRQLEISRERGGQGQTRIEKSSVDRWQVSENVGVEVKHKGDGQNVLGAPQLMAVGPGKSKGQQGHLHTQMVTGTRGRPGHSASQCQLR